jgi:hypothetical protein
MAYNVSWRDLIQSDQYIDQAFANLERQQRIVGEFATTGRASLEPLERDRTSIGILRRT